MLFLGSSLEWIWVLWNDRVNCKKWYQLTKHTTISAIEDTISGQLRMHYSYLLLQFCKLQQTVLRLGFKVWSRSDDGNVPDRKFSHLRSVGS